MIKSRMLSRVLSASLLWVACTAPALSQNTNNTYPLGPDSLKQEGVPTGKVTKHQWTTSKVYEGTERDYWVYVPAQYDGSEPACVMVFQDGQGYVSEDGHSRFQPCSTI